MCGISGAYVKAWGDTMLAQVKNANKNLSKRGPDDSGFFIDDKIALGHTRLSIIDLTTGHQPMFSDDKNKVLIFNGEIYNFKKIKSELSQAGITFKTSSDTEVIIKGYEAFGLQGILNRMEGMFAFALYDKNLQTLFIVRDRFGEKPLYYYIDDSGFYFASELKALTPILTSKTIDKTALNLFLSLTYIPAPYTIYNQIKKLEAGCFLQVKSADDWTVFPYYSLKDAIQSNKPYETYDSAKNDLRNLLEESIEERMISDVPLGAFLSGGVDSSIVSAIMARKSAKPVNTFSIGFKEKTYDESDRADLVAKHIGSQHTLHIVDHHDLLEVADSIIDYFDEPFGDSSALPSWIVAKKAREKVTVVLTGDCADELFGGYEKYLAPYYAARYKALPHFLTWMVEKIIAIIPHTSLTNHFLRKVKKIVRNADGSAFDLHYNLMLMGFSDAERRSLLLSENVTDIKPVVKKYYDDVNLDSPMDKGFYTDIKIVLEGDMLTKVDRMCMMNSLEARVPYLDSKIVKASFRMPGQFKIQGRNKKRILKDTFTDLLPKEVFTNSKKGFGVPLSLWFRNELKSELENVLSEKSISAQNIFNYSEVSRFLNEHMVGKENHASKLWSLYVFQKWYAKNFTGA
jgi:asparagine synthase (glutamine-hydrolysing)